MDISTKPARVKARSLPKSLLLPRRGPRSARGDASRQGLVHDARNLLASLELYSELLAGPGVLTPSFRHYAEELRRVGETGARLLAALAGERPRHPFPKIKDLGAEVMEMRELLRSLAGSEVAVEIECAPCPGRIGLNSEDLLRILFNLVANSVEALHGQAGPRLIRVTVQCGGGASFLPHLVSVGPKTVTLAVRDNGPGIPHETLDRIFRPGFSTRDGGGRGTGLAVVRDLVETAGGRVGAISAPRAGCRIEIDLPLRPGPAALDSAGRSGQTKKYSEIFSPRKKKEAYNAGTFRF